MSTGFVGPTKRVPHVRLPPCWPYQTVCHVSVCAVAVTKRLPHAYWPNRPHKTCGACTPAPLVPAKRVPNVCLHRRRTKRVPNVYWPRWSPYKTCASCPLAPLAPPTRAPHVCLLRCPTKRVPLAYWPRWLPRNVCHVSACLVGPTKPCATLLLAQFP